MEGLLETTRNHFSPPELSGSRYRTNLFSGSVGLPAGVGFTPGHFENGRVLNYIHGNTFFQGKFTE